MASKEACELDPDDTTEVVEKEAHLLSPPRDWMVSDSEPDSHAMSSPKNVREEGARPPEACPQGEANDEVSTGAVPKRRPPDEVEVAELKAKMLEILASKEQADHELSALKKFLEETNTAIATAPGPSAQV